MKVLGNSLNRKRMVFLGRLLEILKTIAVIVTAIAVGLALGQLH